MGGKPSKKIDEKDIENEISIEIENENKNITNILNETITTSTMNIVNDNAQALSNTTSGLNMAAVGDIEVSGMDSEFTINQEVNVTATNTAVSNMIQDAAGMSTLANKLNASVMDKIQNSTDIETSMQAVAKLKNEKEKAQGLGDMLESVTTMMGKMLPGDKPLDEETKMKIKTSIKQSIKNVNINENDIKTIVKNNITNNITQKNTSSCTNQIVAGNNLTAGNVKVTKGGKAKINQISSVTALSSCVIGAAQTSKLVSDITGAIAVDTKTDTGNTTKSTTKQATETEITKKEVTHDAVGQMITSLNPLNVITSLGTAGIVACVVFCIILLIICFLCFFMPSSTNNANNTSTNNTSTNNTSTDMSSTNNTSTDMSSTDMSSTDI